jgi:hypothetical protein
LIPSDDEAMDTKAVVGALVFIHEAPESVDRYIAEPDAVTTAALVPSDDRARDTQLVTDATVASVQVEPESLETKILSPAPAINLRPSDEEATHCHALTGALVWVHE